MAESLFYDLCKAVGRKVLEEGLLLHGVPQEAAKMEKKLGRIKGVLREAEKREMEADVKEWIRELKDVAYDIEDVLDDWSIAQLHRQDQFGTSSQHGNNNNNEPKVDQWRMGDVLLPQTLKNIVTASTELVQKEASGSHNKYTALEVVQQQHDINFNYLHIMRMPRVPGWILALTCLKHIELDYIEDECLPPLGSMPSLEQLYIFGAEKVEKVGDEFLGISNTDDNNREGGGASAAFTAFPRLKQLTFQNLFAWREWEDPCNYRNSNNQIVIMPCLFDLNIFECNRLKSLPQFFECVPLKKMHLGSIYVKKTDMLKIRNTTKDESICKMVKEGSSTILPQQPDFSDVELDGVRNEWLCDWVKYCIRLTRLTLSRCNEASFVGLEVLPSLEKLALWYCDDLIRMAKQVSRISSLKELHLDTMSCLEEWEDPPLRLEDESRHHDISNSGILSNLRTLSLFSCPRLKALPSFLMSTPLERLHISNCTALETWWANEAGQDWRNWTSRIPIFTFTDKHGSPVKGT